MMMIIMMMMMMIIMMMMMIMMMIMIMMPKVVSLSVPPVKCFMIRQSLRVNKMGDHHHHGCIKY